MAITVNFKTKRGIITDRKFQPSEGISIYGKLTGVLMPEPGTFIRMEVLKPSGESLFVKETNANIWGDYDFYFMTPDYSTKLNIKLTATYSISGSDTTTIPIAVGTAVPANMPSPQKEFSMLEWLPLILIVGAGIFLYKELVD